MLLRIFGMKTVYGNLRDINDLMSFVVKHVTPTFDDTEKETLRFVNELRVKHGAQPLEHLLAGEQNNANGCAIAVSIRDLFRGVSVKGGVIDVYSDGGSYETITLPALANQFVTEFDKGQHPHLVK